jgi:hypothetical protein
LGGENREQTSSLPNNHSEKIVISSAFNFLIMILVKKNFYSCYRNLLSNI